MHGIGGERARLAGLGGLSALKPMPTPRMGLLDAQRKNTARVEFLTAGAGTNTSAGAYTAYFAPAGPKKGDLLIVEVYWPGASLPVSRTGWTTIADITAWSLGNNSSYLAYRLLSSAEAALGYVDLTGFTTTPDRQGIVWGLYRNAAAAVSIGTNIMAGAGSLDVSITPLPARTGRVLAFNPARDNMTGRVPPGKWNVRVAYNPVNAGSWGCDAFYDVEVPTPNTSVTVEGQSGPWEKMIIAVALTLSPSASG